MLDLVERIDRMISHSLRRRISAEQFRVLTFQRIELFEQSIVLEVTDRRFGEYVIGVVMPTNFLA